MSLMAVLLWMSLLLQGQITVTGHGNTAKDNCLAPRCGAVRPDVAPVDVSAIQVDKYTDYGPEWVCPAGAFLSRYRGALACRMKVWTCADKSRILLTAEDGKCWCHKVQDGN